MRAFLLFIAVVLFHSVTMAGNHRSKIASVPFEVVGTYIVVKARINESSPLNFILDSGLGSTIVTELSAEDSLTLRHSDKITLNGLGKGKEIEAMISRGNTLQAGKIKFVNQMVNLLEEDIFNLSEFTGKKINGLLGSDFFQDQVVWIDYDKERITFYESSSFVIPNGYVAIPLIIKDNKMYSTMLVSQGQGKPAEAKMLIDTGAELAAWLRVHDNIRLPSKKIYGYIGQGLNGEIKGHLGRVPRLYFGGHSLHNPVVSFPDSACIADIMQDIERDGTVGSQILSRFNLIFDEPNELLYIRPNHNFRKPFRYNIAGMEIVKQQTLPYLPEIYYVWQQSPAERAGIKSGDMILEINGMNGFNADINDIRHFFENPSRRPLIVTILRGNQTFQAKLDINQTL